jgi:gamma-glutamylcyclotransferase
MEHTQPLTSSPNPTVYFGYGSNLWLHQMHIRCPTSQYLGVARMDGFKWIINDRGYANVVAVTPSKTGLDQPNQSNTTTDKDIVSKPPKEDYTNTVFGLVYSLTPTDESRLDLNEGVPVAYTKAHLPCTFWSAGSPSAPESQHSKIDTNQPPTSTLEMLVYIDRKRTTPDEPRKEYIYRMNQGIADAIELGVPEGYVEDVMREFIPAEEGEGRKSIERFAEGQAKEFRDESGVV